MEDNHLEQNSGPESPVESRSGFRAFAMKPIILAGLTLVTASVICLVIALAFFEGTSSGKKLTTDSDTGPPPANRTQLYEEIQQGNLDDLVKKADLALIRSLEEAGVEMKNLQLEDVTLKKYKGRDFHFQQIRFPLAKGRELFVDRVQNKLGLIDANATLTEAARDCWLLSIKGVPTHKIFMDKPATRPVKPSVNSPRMAIVIDDMGEDLRLARGLAATGLKITFSIWPSSSHVKKVAEIARKSGNEIMVHMPMQPQGYPKVNPGKDALLEGMTRDRIVQLVSEAIKKVPNATGLNNHMGSRFTEILPEMKAAMLPLKTKGFFFLDSRTTPDSVARKACSYAGITLYERNIFLDNVKDVSAIEYQLAKAEKIALKHGQSIAIGHPHRQTLQAIKRWAAKKDKRLYVVPVHQLRPRS